MNTETKVTYLGHSGFLVETDGIYLLFDYYIGELPKFPDNSRIFVFVSHRHKDHFNTEIFKLSDKYNVTFFLAYDIKLNAYGMRKYGITDGHKKHIIPIRFDEDLSTRQVCAVDGTNIESAASDDCIMTAGMTEQKNNLRVRTFKSTDSGVAYLVSINGKHIFHAGDLNRWHREEEGKDYNNNMAANYKREIDKLADAEKYIDIAFVPLDPRLGNCYYYGLRHFCETIDSPVIFPMHFWDDYGCRKRFVDEHGYGERIIDIEYMGQVFIIQ